jgi:REP element-mobilizing transposase RayT
LRSSSRSNRQRVEDGNLYFGNLRARDRRRYLRWVFEAKKRFGLSVLDYMVTSNHIHLLVKDTAPDVIARSV